MPGFKGLITEGHHPSEGSVLAPWGSPLTQIARQNSLFSLCEPLSLIEVKRIFPLPQNVSSLLCTFVIRLYGESSLSTNLS